MVRYFFLFGFFFTFLWGVTCNGYRLEVKGRTVHFYDRSMQPIKKVILDEHPFNVLCIDRQTYLILTPKAFYSSSLDGQLFDKKIVSEQGNYLCQKNRMIFFKNDFNIHAYKIDSSGQIKQEHGRIALIKGKPSACILQSRELSKQPIRANTRYSGHFVWRQPPNNVKFYSGRFWQDEKSNRTRHFGFSSAIRFCRQLTNSFFGLPLTFRLPYIDELKTLAKYQDGFDYIDKEFAYWSRTKGGFGYLAYDFSDNSVKSYIRASGQRVRCVSKRSFAFEGKKFDEIIEEFTTLLNRQYSLQKKPKPPQYITLKPLVKDEFETSAMYNQRVQAEEKRVKDYNAKLKKAFEKRLSESMHKPSLDERKIRHLAVLGAFYIVYGTPSFNTVRYDADKESFTIIIKSSKNNLRYTQQVKVPLRYAKQYKALLLNKTPNVDITYDGNVIKIDGVKELRNPTILVEESIYKSLRTIKSFEKFIKTYPNSPFFKKAKAQLDYLYGIRQKAYEKVMLSNNIGEMKAFIEKYPSFKHNGKLQARIAKLIEEHRQLQRDREIARLQALQKAYAAPKNVGDLVCKDLSGLLGSINVKGFVEDLNEENGKISIRIVSDFEPGPYYKGIKLERDVTIWDRFDHWQLCDSN